MTPPPRCAGSPLQKAVGGASKRFSCQEAGEGLKSHGLAPIIRTRQTPGVPISVPAPRAFPPPPTQQPVQPPRAVAARDPLRRARRPGGGGDGGGGEYRAVHERG